MSSLEIKIRHDELCDTLDSVAMSIQSLPDINEDLRKKKVQEIDNMMKSAVRCLKHIELECRSLSPDDRITYKQAIKDHRTHIRELGQELAWARTADKDASLSKEQRLSLKDMKTDEFYDYGRDIQTKSLDATYRIQETIERTKQTGGHTMIKLQGQTEQIQRVYDELYDIDSELQRSMMIVRRMFRRVFTDKYIQCMMVLIFITLAIVIAMKVTGTA
eukprot:232971_1